MNVQPLLIEARPRLRQKELVLGVLIVGLALVLARTFFVEGVLVPGIGGPPAPPRAHIDLADLKIFTVDWASLDAPRPAYDPNVRNIFQYGVVPPPVSPIPTKAGKDAIAKEQAEGERLRKEQEEASNRAEKKAEHNQEIVDPPPSPSRKPEPPTIPYKFIGYIGPQTAKVAVLYDGTDTVLIRAGETLPKGIKALEIGYESIKFGFTDPQFRDQSRTLPMSSSY